MKGRITGLILALLMVGAAPGLAGEMGPDDFLLLVREKNPTLQASLKRLEAFRHTVLSTVAAQRPGAGLRGSSGWYSDNDRSRQGQYSVSAALSQKIDVSGVYPAQEKQILLQYKGLGADHLALVNTTLASAENLYWTAFVARENISLQKGVLNQRREDLRIAEEMFTQQLIPRLDVIRAQAKVEDAVSLVVDAESVYRNSLAQLATLAGGEPVSPRTGNLLVPSLKIQPETAAALLRRNDVQSLEIALERAKVLRKLAAKGMSPTVEGSVGYVLLTDSEGTSSQRQDEFLLSLNVSMPVYDGGRTREDVADKAKGVEAAERSLEAKRNQVDEDIVKALNQWSRAVAVEESKRKQVGRSDEELSITKLMYKEGMGAQIDLLNAQVDNQKVKTEHLNSIKDMYLALVSLKQAMSEYEPAPAK